MGNCIHVVSDESHQKVRVVTLDGKEKEFKASTPIKRITSGRYSGYKLVHQSEAQLLLPHDTKLEPGEAYYLVPDRPVFRKTKLKQPNLVRKHHQNDGFHVSPKFLCTFQTSKLQALFLHVVNPPYRP
ncbi:hypothetical protein Ddye_012568 [Dipteronia dyeriana]|uniref:Uncharacterized protein n=1 Tax=Dipteronia dyeriana TaxID=168575 RepID=A0AAD9X4Q1_9ROSI|nr:hypothetical protein Ddye_012568 [Dipteronia dyeriana]